ncbi:MAG: UDP-N-acetylenolpyruvoylglucosamine reductase [Patescibacteria group bacterium]|nr:UDP-N-acetylenolpyruvoylglucosamine reductase [Patescibacteria group bacterium]
MPTTADKLKERFGAQYKDNESLAKHVNFRIGGPAKYFVEARSTQDLIDAVKIAQEYALPYFILGGGSNTLVADEGYQGLVIKAANRNTRYEGDLVTAEAGVISATVARGSADKGLRGFEWAVSLPGTIGGAVRGNAGCFGGEVKDNLVSVKLLRDGEVIDVPAADMHYGYRHSVLKESGHEQDVILEATFKLTPGDRTEALALIEKNLAGRKASQPLGSSSAGCMFKNYEYSSDEEIQKIISKVEIPQAMKDMHRLGAGWIIDQLGLKGTKMGEAQIAPQHGNFLLNVGHASARDIVTLISFVKTRARDEFGVQLHEEVQYLGF